MPPLIMGRDTPLYACLEQAPEVRRRLQDGRRDSARCTQSDPEARQVIDVAKGLEGLRRQDGIHAAAVVITKEPLTEYLPDPAQARVRAGARGRTGGHPVRDGRGRGARPAQDGLPGPAQPGRHHRHAGADPRAPGGSRSTSTTSPWTTGRPTSCCGRGETIGVFQLEGGAHAGAASSPWRPTAFEDVAALVALYRPGPMAANMHTDYADRKNGRKHVEYLHPDAEEIARRHLRADDLPGVGSCGSPRSSPGTRLAEADNLRKACGKKNREMMAKERVKFVEGCERTGYGAEPWATSWFDIIEPFADYAFNKSHSYGYGLVAYQTAYLKANYGPEYLSALLTSVKANLEKAGVYLAECRAMGIEVVVPDINASASDFTPDVADPGAEDPLRALRGAQRGRGPGGADRRRARGPRPFADFFDFCERVDTSVLNKRTIESLIKAGAFDSLGHPRHGPGAGVRADRRRHHRPAARARHGGHVPVRRRSRTARPSTSGRRSPTPSSPRRSAWPTRRRCSASTCRTTR